MVVLDTCAIIELLKQNNSISQQTKELIDVSSRILSVSFAEIACKVKLNKLEIGISVQQLYQSYCEIKHVKIIKIGIEEWFESIDLEWTDNKDPADRLILSYAKKLDLPIVTSDLKMKKYYEKVVW